MRYTISCALASLLPTLAPAVAHAEVPNVVTDIPPVHALVSLVMGDLGQPQLLLAKGADEHDFALKPSQMRGISDATLAVWIGPELTPWMERALQGSNAAQLALLDAPGTERRSFAEGGGDHDHDHAGEEQHDHDAEGHDDGHSHTGTDPHAWLDPENAVVWTGLIAAELTRLDPENAVTYSANADAARARIATLDADLKAQLAPVADKAFVAFHDAYGYFTAHYGLQPAGHLALGDAASPGAAHITELRAEIAAGGIVCLFPEVQHDPTLLTQLSEGSSVRIGGALDPVGSSLEPGPAAYETLLHSIADTLSDCLKG
ncbi:zinc ABC transporter substrate-binding protein [Paracoccaceae bacterium]